MSAVPVTSFLVNGGSVAAGASTDDFIGATATLDVSFSNGSASEPGYAPFIDLVLPATADGVVFSGATYLGSAVEAQSVTFDAAGEATHPFLKNPDGTPVILSGPPGATLVALTLPFGSFTPGQTPADIAVNLAVSPSALLDLPLDVAATGGFAFGNSPLGVSAANPVIIGAQTDLNVVPKIVILKTVYIGPEQETATGPSYPRDWDSVATIAPGQTLTGLVLTQTLPDGAVFLPGGSTLLYGAGVTPGTITYDALTNTVTGTFADPVTGGAPGTTPTLQAAFYVTQGYTAGAPILDPSTGSFAPLTDSSTLAANWQSSNPGNPATVSAGPVPDTITAKSIAIQNGVTDLTHGASAYQAGDTLQYSLDGQVSNYFDVNDLVIQDKLGDGQTFDAGFTPTITIAAQGQTLFSGAVAANEFTVSGKAADGTSLVTFDVSQILTDNGQAGDLNGGTAAAPNPATVDIALQTTIDPDYVATPAPSVSPLVDQGDTVGDSITFSGEVAATGAPISDGSHAAITLPTNTVSKSVYAVNGVLVTGPVTIQAGDLVTYELDLKTPLTSTQNVVLSDFLPLPTFSATDTAADGGNAGITFVNTQSAAAPAVGTADFGPNDTFHAAAPGNAPTITTNATANSISFNLGDYTLAPTNYPINDAEILYTVRAGDESFADGLLLTNQVHATEANSFGATTTSNAIVQVTLGEPELNIQKAVVSTDDAKAIFVGTAGPSGIIDDATLAATPLSDSLHGIVAGDTVGFEVVVQNTGTGPNGAFDVMLHDTLPAGFAGPTNVSVTDGAGNPIAYIVVGGGLFDPNGGLQLFDHGASGALAADNAASGANIAVITYNAQALATVPVPDYDLRNVATISNYAAEQGGINHAPTTPAADLTASTDVYTAVPVLAKAVISTSFEQPASGAPALADLAIGETATYDITLTLPKGTGYNVTLSDLLPSGGAGELDLVSATVKSIGADVTGSALAVGATANGPGGSFEFGDLTDAVNAQGAADQIVVEVTARAADVPANKGGEALTNTATVTETNPNDPLGAPYSATSTATETLVEPELALAKTVSQSTAQAGDTITYTLHYTNGSGAGSAAAFGSVITDSLAKLAPYAVFDAGSVKILPSSTAAATIVTGNAAGDTGIEVDAAEIDPGQSIYVTYQATLLSGAVTGTVLPNVADVSGSTLPGGDPNGRIETKSGSADVTVQLPGVTKLLVSGSDPNIAAPDLTVGETGSYQIVVTLPHGDSPGFSVVDTLPAGLAYVAGSASIVTVGGNVATTASTISESGQTLTVSLGDVTDRGTGADTAADQIVIDYQATVANVAANSNGAKDVNTVSTVSDGKTLTTATATADIVAPHLTLSKTVNLHGAAPVAGTDVTYTMVIGKAADNASPAYDVDLVDPLPPDETYDPGSATASGGATVSYANGILTVTDPTLLPTDAPITVTYSAHLNDTATPGEQLKNIGSLTYASQPTGGVTEPTVTASATVAVVLQPTEVKSILSLSNPFSATQVVTGETVTYKLLTTLDPGTQHLRVADSLPSGLTFVSATVGGIGGGLSGAGLASGAITPTGGVYDFGTVAAAVGGADTFEIDITAMVAQAAGGTLITNTAIAETSAPGSNTVGLKTSASSAPTLTDVKSSLSGVVFTDNNDDGVADGADKGLAGVTVKLLDGNGAPTGVTTTTGASGGYSFTGLEVGAYSVQVVAPGSDGYSPVGANGNATLDSIANAAGATATVSLAPGANTPNQNAGVYVPVSLSGTVFNDQNADGSQEAGDKGIANDTVQLLDASGHPILGATTTTAADGSYSFTGLLPGAYSVAITDPAGDTFSPTGTSGTAPNSIVNGAGKTAPVTLTSGQSATAQDAGAYGPGSLSGTVFTDQNADGVIDGADAGLGGVTVELLNSAGAPTGATAVTDANGNYDFIGLHPANYAVQIAPPAGDVVSPKGANANPALDSIASGAGKTAEVAVNSNTNTPNQNAGLYVPVSISGVVFTDQNADGVQQAGDTAITGDIVTLYSGATAVATTTTGLDGAYSFNGLTPGSYTVAVTDPAGDRFSPAAIGNPPADSVVNGAGVTPVITLSSGQSAPYENAGAYAPATLTGHVFFDNNGDGVQEGGEANVHGVIATLLDGNGVPTGATTTTAADGSYSFTGLTPGSYSVRFTTPAGDSIAPVGGNASPALDSIVDGAATTPLVTLTSGETKANQNAGFTQVGSLSGTVFTDNNDDGVLNGGDGGLAGVTVKLLDSAGHPTGATATTDLHGRYSFASLLPGSYSVQVVAPGADGFSPIGANANPALDSEVNAAGNTSLVSVAAGQDTPNQNAGVYVPVSFSGNVFVDQNADGVKQAGDVNLPGDTVTLYSGANVIATTATDASGNYSFTGLKPGSYSATVGAPAGDRFSPTASGNPPVDSVVNAAGSTPVTILTSGQSATNENAGLYAPAKVAGTLFLDAHCDGTDDYGDPAFAGVTVKLLNGAGQFTGLTAVTDANGAYSFGSLTPGQYQVQFVAPIGTAFVEERIGGNNAANSDADPATGLSEVFTVTSGESDPTHGAGLRLTGGYSNFPTTLLSATQTFGLLSGSGTVIGGAGTQHDVISGAAGDYILNGGMGTNLIEGGYGDNLILAGCGPYAQIQGLGLNDVIFGGPGDDLIQGHSGNEFEVAGVGDQMLIATPGGTNTFIANANDGTISYAGGAFSNIAIGDDFITSGNTKIVYAKGDGVVSIADFRPGNGDTLTIYGFTGPTATGTSGGYDVLYFGPNQAVLLPTGYGLLNGANPAITYSAALPADAPLTISIDAAGGLTLTELGVATPILAPSKNPTITGAVAGQATADTTPATPFHGVTIGDPTAGQTETVTITPFSAADGIFAALGGGSIVNGAYTITGTPQIVTATIDALQFAPTLHQVAAGQSVTTGFTISVLDAAGNSATNALTTLTATRADLPPVIAGIVAGQPVADTASLRPFAATTVADPDGGLQETATVTLSSTANGALADAAGGSYDATHGVFTATGSAQSITAILQALSFTPTAHEAVAGTTVTTGLALSVTDALGGTSTAAASVVATQSAAPVIPPLPPVVPPVLGGGAVSVAPYQPYVGGSADTQLTGSLGGNTVTLGDGADSVSLGGYGNRVVVGNGNDTVSLGVGNSTVVAGNGNDVITAGGYSNSVAVGTGNDTIDAGYNATITAAGGNQTITLNGYSNVVTVGGTGQTSITGGSGNNTVTVGNGNAAVSLSGFSNSVTVGDGTNTIDAGFGAAIHATGGDQSITLQGYQNMVFIGGNAQATIAGGLGNDHITTVAGVAHITLGGYGSVVTTGGANDTITDGVGASTFNVGGAQAGLEIINKFAANAGSVVDVAPASAGSRSAADLFASLVTNAGGSAELDLPNAGAVVFNGLTPSQLQAANFRVG